MELCAGARVCRGVKQTPMATERASRPADRRKETRYGMQLKGRLRAGDTSLPLEIGDLSFSGALVLMKNAPPAGASAELWIEDYGPILAHIVHSGTYFCGVAFKDASGHKTPLLRWIDEDTPPMRENEAMAGAA
jgi:hypothetical protein